jgi:hypothetical protein
MVALDVVAVDEQLRGALGGLPPIAAEQRQRQQEAGAPGNQKPVGAALADLV